MAFRMRYLSYVFIFVLNSHPIYALSWEVIGQESKVPVHHGELNVSLDQSCGQVTIQILETQKIPYIGTAAGINSILGTPTGSASIAKISEDSMRVYGWCYEVDGVQPDVMPDKCFFKYQSSHLRWFFAYSLFDKGEWKEFCTPAHLHPLKNL